VYHTATGLSIKPTGGTEDTQEETSGLNGPGDALHQVHGAGKAPVDESKGLD